MGGADPQRDLREMQKLLDGYISARKYIRSIARHPEIFTSLFDIAHVEQSLHRIRSIKQVRFQDWHLTETERRQIYGKAND